MREHDWVSAHIFYHDSLDPLLADLVRPLVAELAHERLIEQFFFLRYWDGGNHLRLRVLPAGGRHDRVRQRVADRSAAFLRTRPATATVPPARYAATAARLAAREQLTGYARHPYPNNTVVFLPYQREHLRYGYGASMEAVEGHFAESSQIALRLVGPGLPPGRRATAAWSLIMVSWLCCEPDPDRLTRAIPAADRSPPAADRGFRRQRRVLRQLADRLQALAARGADLPTDGTLAAWARSVCRLRDAFGDPRTRFGVVDVCAHLACNRLGVGLDEETRLRYLATRTVADLAGRVEQPAESAGRS